MTTRNRIARAATGLAGAALLAVGVAWATPDVAQRADAQVRLAPAAIHVVCTIHPQHGTVHCRIPTQGRDARVVCRLWEDGSGRCVVRDPDAGRKWVGGKKPRR